MKLSTAGSTFIREFYALPTRSHLESIIPNPNMLLISSLKGLVKLDSRLTEAKIPLSFVLSYSMSRDN